MESQDTPLLLQDECKGLSQYLANAPHARLNGNEATAKILASKPDLFWNDADPEHCGDSIFELVDREWANGAIDVGDTMVVQRAVRLENITVRVIPDAKNPEYIDYEIVEEVKP